MPISEVTMPRIERRSSRRKRSYRYLARCYLTNLFRILRRLTICQTRSRKDEYDEEEGPPPKLIYISCKTLLKETAASFNAIRIEPISKGYFSVEGHNQNGDDIDGISFDAMSDLTKNTSGSGSNTYASTSFETTGRNYNLNIKKKQNKKEQKKWKRYYVVALLLLTMAITGGRRGGAAEARLAEILVTTATTAGNSLVGPTSAITAAAISLAKGPSSSSILIPDLTISF